MSRRACRVWVQEHPRWCGACAHSSNSLKVRPGTPPPVRGLRGDRPERPLGQRNTPARAGPALVRAGPPEPRGEHPRPCGACSPLLGWKTSTPGIPPPVRGLRASPGGIVCLTRDTPARAGPANKSLLGRRWKGIPPPVRGLRTGAPSCRFRTRDTPARAGPADRPLLSATLLRDTHARAGPARSPSAIGSAPPGYPRPCGACCVLGICQRCRSGIPTPVRGLLRSPPGSDCSGGIPTPVRGLRLDNAGPVPLARDTHARAGPAPFW